MKRSVQLNLPPVPVKRLDSAGEPRVQKVDAVEIPLEMARAELGKAIERTINRTGSKLKEFGDPSQVNRLCDGSGVPTILARMWQREDTRKELVASLATVSGDWDVRSQITERKVG